MRTNNINYTRFTSLRDEPNFRTPGLNTGLGIPVFTQSTLPAAAISKMGDQLYNSSIKALMVFDGTEWDVAYPPVPPPPTDSLSYAAMQSDAASASIPVVSGVSRLIGTGVLTDTIAPVNILRNGTRFTNTSGVTITVALNSYFTIGNTGGAPVATNVSAFFIKNGVSAIYLGNATSKAITASTASSTSYLLNTLVTLGAGDYVEVWINSSATTNLIVRNFSFSIGTIPAAFAGFQQGAANPITNVANRTLLPLLIGSMSNLPYAGGLIPQSLDGTSVLRNTSGSQMVLVVSGTVTVSLPAIPGGVRVTLTLDFLKDGGNGSLSGDTSTTAAIAVAETPYSITLTKTVILEQGEYLSAGFVLEAGQTIPRLDVLGFNITAIQSNLT